VQVMMRPLGPGMMQQIQQPCSHCNQTGYSVPNYDMCGGCHSKVVSLCLLLLLQHSLSSMQPGYIMRVSAHCSGVDQCCCSCKHRSAADQQMYRTFDVLLGVWSLICTQGLNELLSPCQGCFACCAAALSHTSSQW